MEHENKGQGGTQVDYEKPGILNNDDMVEHYIGNLGYNANVGLAQFKRRGLGRVIDTVSYEPDDMAFEFMGAIQRNKVARQQEYTRADAERNLDKEGVKGSMPERNATTEETAGSSQMLSFEMGQEKAVSNRQDVAVEAEKEGQSPY